MDLTKEMISCGPEAMMKALYHRTAGAGIHLQVSMENRMACAVGASWLYRSDVKRNETLVRMGLSFLQKRFFMNKLENNFLGISMKNPLIAASGTFGFGSEYNQFYDVSKLGGICSKGLTLDPKQGNSGTRIWETASGMINSIGLQNPGVQHFIENEFEQMKSLVRLLSSISEGDGKTNTF